MLTTLLLTATLAAECERGWSRDAVLGAAARAEEAHGALDVEALHAAADQVRERLPCLGYVLTVLDAARIHRVEGLSRFAGGDHEGAAMAFAASRALEPGWSFDPQRVPETHPLQVIYAKIPTHSAAYAGVPTPAAGEVLVDGEVRRGRPKDWPAVVQVVTEDRGVLTSAYLWPDDPFVEVDTDAAPLALFGSEVFAPPTREDRPGGVTSELEHRKDDRRYEAVAALEHDPGATELILWVLFTDPDSEVRFKAWRILRARSKRGVGDMVLQREAVVWIAEHGKDVMKHEAIDLLPRLPAE